MPDLPPVIFLDAAGTLIQVREHVAKTYEAIAADHAVKVSTEALVHGFRSAWKDTPPILHDQPPADDDRAWWHTLVSKTFAYAMGQPLGTKVLDPLFEDLYMHYSRPQAWIVFDDVVPVLEQLHAQGRKLYVLSNFDKRLHRILEGHGLTRFFQGMIISSEIGASKPHRRIFEAALAMAQVRPEDCLHVGDDADADVAGAEAMGIRALLVRRPEVTLRNLLG